VRQTIFWWSSFPTARFFQENDGLPDVRSLNLIGKNQHTLLLIDDLANLCFASAAMGLLFSNHSNHEKISIIVVRFQKIGFRYYSLTSVFISGYPKLFLQGQPSPRNRQANVPEESLHQQ
jgi:hypothetical protein